MKAKLPTRSHPVFVHFGRFKDHRLIPKGTDWGKRNLRGPSECVRSLEPHLALVCTVARTRIQARDARLLLWRSWDPFGGDRREKEEEARQTANHDDEGN